VRVMSDELKPVERRDFGRTGLSVGVLGLGTADIGFLRTDDLTLDSILSAADDAGINLVDTAAMYDGAEEKLGRLLVGRREKFLISTKCGRYLPQLVGASPRVLRRLRRSVRKILRQPALEWHPSTLQQNIEESLRRLRTDYIDLLQLHSCSEDLLKRGEIIQVLRRAKDSGKARYIGYSGDGPAALWATRSGCFDAVQLSINVADQQAVDSVLPEAFAGNVGIVAKRPIANAVWRSTELPPELRQHVYWKRMRALDYSFLSKSDAAAIALRFTLRTGVHTAIVGVTSLQHMRSNIKAIQNLGADDPQYEVIRERWRTVAGPDWVGQM
jgi:aryl-alcohol dehydrogenase-like predicted oxidoreductase